MNIISKVEVRNFRSHGKYLLELKNPTTLIVGENGSGKTSLIEALYIGLRGKSFRSSDKSIVKDRTSYYRVTVVFGDGKKRVVECADSKKSFKVDDKKYTRLPVKCKYPVVLFEPDDLSLIHASPSKRRRFLDVLISQLDEKYHRALIRYDKALKQRNKLLNEAGVGSDSLFAWNVILAQNGSYINQQRKEIVELVNSKIESLYRSIAGNNDNVGVLYSTPTISESQYLHMLDSSLFKDKVLGCTNFGPHREDLEFVFNNSSAADTASRGEVRSMVLSLKFIETKLIKELIGLDPVILLDDIFSELDNTRQLRLVNNFKDHQVVITGVAAPVGMGEDIKL